MNKPQDPQSDIDAEYRRLSESKKFYQKTISLWKKLEKASLIFFSIGFVLLFLHTAIVPEGVQLRELFPDHPLLFYLFLTSAVLIFGSVIGSGLVSKKLSKVRHELELNRDERLYLRAYETSKTIDSYLNESNPKRRLYLKKSALQNAQQIIEVIESWGYGNIRLVASLIGDKMDLLKDNMRRLVLSNVAKGDENHLRKFPKYSLNFAGTHILHH